MTASTDLASVAPAFIEMAHRIVWCSVATIDPAGRPRSRVLHPFWQFDGEHVTGWIATGPQSPKAAHLDAHPLVSITYWAPSQDTCTAECRVEWAADMDTRTMVWELFEHGPAPVGYNPAMIPGWTDPAAPSFGVLRLTPWRLRVMPGSVLMTGGKVGTTLVWQE